MALRPVLGPLRLRGQRFSCRSHVAGRDPSALEPRRQKARHVAVHLHELDPRGLRGIGTGYHGFGAVKARRIASISPSLWFSVTLALPFMRCLSL